MTYLINDPKKFAADSLAGMVAANSTYLQAVHGGVVRATASPQGEVAIVVGGGSGHYPAFAGWVGPGMAHGSVCGNIFASPSTSQVISVAKNSHNGGGVVLLFGNYAGDCLHFGKAAVELEERGIPTVVIPISDDIASNSPEQHEDRRGIAGDLMVVKVAGAAASSGFDIGEVERIARKANNATRSLGVAFSGCTLPGAGEPLFTVPDGQYSLGLGIHGEPGLSNHSMTTASDIAELLVERILNEEPERNGTYKGRVTVLVNGLGATKYEELFLLYGCVATLLEKHDITVVAPVVGEQVTSLDMAGASLTLMFLDDELEQMWLVAADTPSFKTGYISAGSEARILQDDDQQVNFSKASAASRAQAKTITAYLGIIAHTMIEAESDLGRLDSIAGDGDHGQGMVLGATAAHEGAVRALNAGAGARSLLAYAGECWEEGAGGTSGGYWGSALKEMATELSDSEALASEQLGYALAKGVDSFASPGGAVVGDKTMVDATVPFSRELKSQLDKTNDLSYALLSAARVAKNAADETSKLIAKRGRARTHGEASLGHPDPGAVSFALLMEAIATRSQN